eukprot:scaffold105860_cov35-Attheya_sp.AAC.1
MSMLQGITFRLMQTLLFASFVLQVCQGKSQIQRDFAHRFLAEEEHHDDEEEHHEDEKEHHDEDEHHHDEEDHQDDEDKPWVQVILATLLVNCAALVGVVVLIPSIGKVHMFCLPWRTVRSSTEASRAEHKKLIRSQIVDIGIPSFACGALLAATVFLILPESLILIAQGVHGEDEEHEDEEHEDEEHEEEDHRYLESEDHDDHEEGEGFLKFGVAVMAGFLLTTVFGALFPRAQDHECDDHCPPNVDSDVNKTVVIPTGNIDDEEEMCSDQFHDLHASSSPTKTVVASGIP